MQNKSTSLPLAAAALVGAMTLGAGAAHAEGHSVNGLHPLAKERFMIRARGIAVVPDEDGTTNIGGDFDVDDAYVPELDVTYFATDNIAFELIAATTPHDDIKLNGSDLGDLDVGEVWLLPPTLTAQYHFLPHGQFSPYLGAGVNYTFTYNEDEAGGVVTNLDLDDGFGLALQAGFDYWLTENWGVNLDVKKIFLEVDATVNNGAVTGEVELDPWIFGVGVSYRF